MRRKILNCPSSVSLLPYFSIRLGIYLLLKFFKNFYTFFIAIIIFFYLISYFFYYIYREKLVEIRLQNHYLLLWSDTRRYIHKVHR